MKPVIINISMDISNLNFFGLGSIDLTISHFLACSGLARNLADDYDKGKEVKRLRLQSNGPIRLAFIGLVYSKLSHGEESALTMLMIILKFDNTLGYKASEFQDNLSAIS